MKRASHFRVPPAWKLLLRDMGIDVQAVLAHARLPADLFHRESAMLSPSEYFQLWSGVEKAAGDAEVPLLLARHLSVEAFDAPLFASICSPNLHTALKRIQQYKPLIGPMELDICVDDQSTTLTIRCYGHEGPLPRSLELSEIVFFTQLARLATRESIRPVGVTVSQLPESVQPYREYFGCAVNLGTCPEVRFANEDAQRPFLTANAGMWNTFSEGLNQNLARVSATSTTVERVRAVLVELLPAGISSIETVAEKLAMSKRTLQRKLTAESASFHSVLQAVRTDLADHYLNRPDLSLSEISFLLGYHEVNSFSRAFTAWRGVAPSNYRETEM